MRRYALFAAATHALACRRDTSIACTAIGCVNTLSVEVQDAPPGPITVQATPVGTPDSMHTAACPGETGCTNTVSFRDFAPVHVHLTITTTAGVRRWDVRPNFDTSQPNGPGCPEICRYGTVRLTWREPGTHLDRAP
jgi:hypothetical protein